MSAKATAPVRRRARSFRLGETPGKRPGWVFAVIGFAVGAVLFGGGGYLVGQPSEQERMTNEIRAADAARDAEQIKSLTGLARTMRDDLAPIVAGMAGDVPEADVIAWQQTVAEAAQSLDDPPSGTTATNVARTGFTTAVDQLSVAVDTYRQGMREVAILQRDLAVTTWSIGAAQLDQLSIDAGYGHQHVYLEGSADEAFTADDAEEGTG